MEQGLKAHIEGCQNLISTTVYSIACKFDALTDMEEFHIQTALDLPNNSLIFILAPVPLQYGASIFVTEIQLNDPLTSSSILSRYSSAI